MTRRLARKMFAPLRHADPVHLVLAAVAAEVTLIFLAPQATAIVLAQLAHMGRALAALF
jgi:hypothetical protein